MRIILPLIFCFLSGIFTLQAQKLDYRLGYMLIQLEKDAKLDNVLDLNASRLDGSLTLDRVISKRLGIYLIKFDHSRIHQGELLDQLRYADGIAVAQFDHITTLRVEPDDPDFRNQWQWLNEGQINHL